MMKKTLSFLMAVMCVLSTLIAPISAADTAVEDVPMGYACLTTHQKPGVMIQSRERIIEEPGVEGPVEEAPSEVVPAAEYAAAATSAAPVILMGTPELDGQLDDIYLQSYVYDFPSDAETCISSSEIVEIPEIGATMHMLWDENYLYIHTSSIDNTLVNTAENFNDGMYINFAEEDWNYTFGASADRTWSLSSNIPNQYPFDLLDANSYAVITEFGWMTESALPLDGLEAGNVFDVRLQIMNVLDGIAEEFVEFISPEVLLTLSAEEVESGVVEEPDVVPVSPYEDFMLISTNSYEFTEFPKVAHRFSIYVDGEKLWMPQVMPNGQTYSVSEFKADRTFTFNLSQWVGESGVHEIEIVPVCEFIGTGNNGHNASLEDLTVTIHYVAGTGHQHEFKKTTVYNTCDTAGYIRSSCSCGSYIELENLPAGPDWDLGTVTVQPTETTAGEIEYTCYCCGKTKTETIDALGSLGQIFNKGRIAWLDRDWNGEFGTSFMTLAVNGNFVGYEDSANGVFKAVVPAERYEEALNQQFACTEFQLFLIRQNYYDEAANTYTANYPGAFGLGREHDREYLGYTDNGDGTYTVYYHHINFGTLDRETLDVLIGEGVQSWEGPEYLVHDGVIYRQGAYADGYYVRLGTDDYGKKYTVDLNGNIVRIHSASDYTADDLPETMNTDDAHVHVFTEKTVNQDCTKYIFRECSCAAIEVLEVVPDTHIHWGSWTETDVNGTFVRECACGASETMTIPQDTPVNGTDPEANDMGADLSNTEIELIESILTDDEQTAVANGEMEVSFELTVAVPDLESDDLTEEEKAELEEDKAKIEEKVQEIVQKTETEAEIILLDIKLDMVQVQGNNEIKVPVTETSGKIKITIAVPDALINETTDREYKIIRVHEGEVDVIEGDDIIFDAEAQTLTFMTDRFSTYALTYVDNAVNIYTVTYTDGLSGAAFEDQVYRVGANSATPAFDGTPERSGYIFSGWTPAVEDTVTADAVYTAVWEEDKPAFRLPMIFPVKIADSENGDVSTNTKAVIPGHTVRLNIKAEEGYVLDTLTVKYGSRTVKTTCTNGIYSFIMPFAGVTVTAEFKSVD